MAGVVFTKELRHQHAEIVRCIKKLRNVMNSNDVAASALEIHALLMELQNLLHEHLNQEDKSLYPELLASNDQETCELVRQLKEGIGDIESMLSSYFPRWDSAGKIRARTGDFVSETMALFKVMYFRIDKEDTVIYPLADRLHLVSKRMNLKAHPG